MKRGYSHRIATGLQPPRQRTGHAPFSSGTRYGKRDLLIVQPFDESRGDFDGAAGSPSLTRQADDDCPGTHKVTDPTRHFERMKSSFGRRIEMVGLPEGLPQSRRLAPCQFDGLFIAQGQAQRFVARLLGNDGDGDRSSQALVKVPNESISDTQQLIGSGAGYSNLDSALEAAPEGPKIFVHDRQSSKSED